MNRFPSFRKCHVLCGLAVTWLLPLAAEAAPPEVKAIFPAGIQRGKTISVKVLGKADKESAVWANRRGIAVRPGLPPRRFAFRADWSSETGLTIERGKEDNHFAVTVSGKTPPGVYWLRWYNDNGASALRPLVVGTLPEINETEPNDELSAKEPLSLPITVNAVLEKAGAVDSFPVPLEAGQTLVASVESHRLNGSPMDGVVQVVSPEGVVAAQNDDHHAFDPQVVYLAKGSGTHYVRVFAFPAQPNSTINFAGGAEYIYRLTMTTGPFVDHPVPLVRPVGEGATVRLVGWNIPEDQAQISIDDELPQVEWPGSFLFERMPTAPEGTNVIEETTEPQSIPLLATGHIEQPGEVDVYRFPGTKGTRVSLDVAARGFDSPLDPVLTLYGPDGKEIRTVDDESRGKLDVSYTQALPADGEYRVEIRDRFDHAGPDYVYLLSIAPEQPDFTATVSQDRHTVAAGKEVSIEVEINRIAGMDQEITFAVDPLPVGITAEPVVSKMKSETEKKLTLKLAAQEGAVYNGPIRIVGRAEGVDETVATAPAGIDGFDTPDLWLTVQKAK